MTEVLPCDAVATRASTTGGAWLRAALLLAIAAALVTLVELHVDGIDGPDYWRWTWRRMDAQSVYPALLAALLPVLAAQVFFERGRVAVALHLLVIGTIAAELTCALLYPGGSGLRRVADIVRNPWATSYFTAATGIDRLEGWLGAFARLQPDFPLHANNKPPGPVLFYLAMLRGWGGNQEVASAAGGLLLGSLGALVGPATFAMARALRLERRAAFQAASLVAVSPGLVVFLPQFDQAWPLFTCAAVGLWALATERRWIWAAFGTGLVLGIAAFCTWNVLTVGFVLVLSGVVALARRENRISVPDGLKLALAALAGFLLVQGGIAWSSGYDPLRVFLSSRERVVAMLVDLGRHYPRTIGWDLADAVLGAGWLLVPLSGMQLWNSRVRFLNERTTWSLLPWVLLVVVAVGGFFRGETARTCLYVVPLLALPAGLELAQWPIGPRLAALVGCGAIVAAIYSNMVFVSV